MLMRPYSYHDRNGSEADYSHDPEVRPDDPHNQRVLANKSCADVFFD